MRPMVGDGVTVKKRVEAYYSSYGGNPECWLEPNDIGIVTHINVPCVIDFGHKTFVAVDFGKHGKTWRAGVYAENLRRIRE
jgi:hypothetical protein